jgi:hypothetical protein
MILDIPIIADLELIRQKRQILIDKSLMQANRRRIAHDYKVGDLVLRLVPQSEIKSKLDLQVTGPFPIEQVFSNGTVIIRHSDYHTEHLNIRRIKPYRS